MGRAGRLTVSALVALGVVAAVGIAIHQGVGPLPDAEGCRAEVDGRVVELDTEQAENAALIAGIAVGRGLPPRAASIALATAYQESKLLNLEHGDRDSVGLFQQRPSQGWGTVDQILNPPYAVNAFYDALVKVEGYQDMPITEAAQAVQRSAFPDAYADHEADARVLASALTGETTARSAASCTPTPPRATPTSTVAGSPTAPTRSAARSSRSSATSRWAASRPAVSTPAT